MLFPNQARCISNVQSFKAKNGKLCPKKVGNEPANVVRGLGASFPIASLPCVSVWVIILVKAGHCFVMSYPSAKRTVSRAVVILSNRHQKFRQNLKLKVKICHVLSSVPLLGPRVVKRVKPQIEGAILKRKNSTSVPAQ